ncbi:MAG TPA: SDR family oxidoreductase [Anaerolineae bacterium]|nr:SDR family oxidoreductase [Anaerolineae bacterium]
MSPSSPHVAIITGAASGIGQHWAGVLAARDDFLLALADIDEASLRSAFSPSDRLRLLPLDIRSPGDWQALVGDTLGTFGRIDYLFNIAGGGRLGFLLDQPPENVEVVLDVNLKGPIYGMRLVGQVMAAQRSGHIVNVGSLAGLSPTPGNALYSAAKSGLRAASLAAAVELRQYGVYVTVIAPDVVDTPLARRHFDQPEAAALARSGGRVLTVQDMEAAFWHALRDRPLEINLPRWRGWLAKVNSLYPPLMLKLYEPLKQRGLKRLELTYRARNK